jgi:hypothetical protein
MSSTHSAPHSKFLALSVLGAMALLSCGDDSDSKVTNKSDAGGRDAGAFIRLDAGRLYSDASCDTEQCTTVEVCCNAHDDLVYVTCCDPEFPGCPTGYSYDQCTSEQRCADSPEPLPDCLDSCGRYVEPICENRGERDVWACPTSTSDEDSGTSCEDAG